MINVVDYEMVGRVDYFTVHPDLDSPFPRTDTANGIESVTVLNSIPFVLIQSILVENLSKY